MFKRHYPKALLLVVASLGLALSTSSSATAQGPIDYLPMCGPDARANTIAWQDKIDNTPDGYTLVLPVGVCVLAHCTVARDGQPCYGRKVAGVGSGRFFSAVDIGKKQNLTLAGAPGGTSVVKLDPNPTPRSDGYHRYCGDTHVFSIRKSSYITLRDFTVDGSDGELPEDTTQCPINNPQEDTGKINEHMHDVQVENSTDVTIERMTLIKAHGDGLNLFADRTPSNTNILFTERVLVTNTDFLDNDRSGIAFQRNVGHVTIRGNYFRNSGDDQDLDMEPTGSLNNNNLGPYEVDIDNNLFERVKPGLTVALGASTTQPSDGVRFTNNTIRPFALSKVDWSKKEGGCISVYRANNTTIAGNRIKGAKNCVTLAARRVTGLRVENNYLDGYTNVANSAGNFSPSPVINISGDHENQDNPQTCGQPSQPLCKYLIYYPDRITIAGNIITQHVQNSQGIKLSDVDELVLANNTISHTHNIAPAGNLPLNNVPRPTSINLFFGLHITNGEFLNERTQVNSWSITGNRLSEFADGIRIRQLQAHVRVSGAEVNANVFNTAQSSPQGIWLVGAPGSAQSGFIDSLMVDSNLFGCGFGTSSVPPPYAFVRPSGQAHTGNIGFMTTCQ